MSSQPSSRDGSKSATLTAGNRSRAKIAMAIAGVVAVVAVAVALPLLRRPGTATAAPVGDWTFKTRSPLTARFVREDGDAVVLRAADGTETKVPLTELSPADIGPLRAWSGPAPAKSGAAGPPALDPASRALLPVEIHFSDGTTRLLPAVVVKVIGSETLLITLEHGSGPLLEQAFAVVEHERGRRRVPLTPYATTNARNGNQTRLIFSGPKGDLPAPFVARSGGESKVGERLKFTGCDLATLGGQGSFARWSDEAEVVAAPPLDLEFPTTWFRLSSGRKGLGIVATAEGMPVAIVAPSPVVRERNKVEFLHVAYAGDMLECPAFPSVLRLLAVRPRESKTARFVVQVFDPEKKISELRLLGIASDRMDDPSEFALAGKQWTNKPAGGLELKLIEGVPERAIGDFVDPVRWPHVRSWSGEFEVAEGISSLDYQLVDVDAAGKLTRAGQAQVEHIFQISSP